MFERLLPKAVPSIRSFPSSITDEHGDHAVLSHLRELIFKSAGGEVKLTTALPSILQDAIDFVIDPVRTARNLISELDNVEKTFVGLKVEHFLRDFLNVPKGLRDMCIDGIDVDIKNTVGGTWMIPQETYRSEEPCLLIVIADGEKRFWLGLVFARNSYLGAMNQDKKRSFTKKGMQNILWLVEGKNLPPSRWKEIDMERFRELRRIKGGKNRAVKFFMENLGKKIHRTIIQSLLHPQLDYMKRVRGNGGARDPLKSEGIAVLSGKYDKSLLKSLGFASVSNDEFVAVKQPSDR
jgi:Restriction endonuclease NaeI